MIWEAHFLGHRGANDVYVGLLIPQTVTSGNRLFTMTSKNNSSFAYVCTEDEILKPGDKLVFDIETNADTGFMTVSEWSEQGGTDLSKVGNIQVIDWIRHQ